MRSGTAAGTIPAVDDVSFTLAENETLGLVGESGCGKTTTGKAILKLMPVTAGGIRYRDPDTTPPAPAELSGGEKRRIGIARVLAVRPKLIVADEPTSALDVSIQAQVINLLRDLQDQFGLSYLFISHDLPLVELVSHRVAVMYLGQIVELGPAPRIAHAPRHPYTSVLWSSLAAERAQEAVSVTAPTWGVFDFERPSAGCRFAPRCPLYAARGQPPERTAPRH